MANHASHAALPYPIRGARFTVLLPYLDADGDPADPTTPDTEISKDDGAAADTAEEVSSPKNSVGMLTLTGDELDASCASLAAKAASGPKTTLATLYPRVLPVVVSGTALDAGSSSGGTISTGDRPAYDVTGCFFVTVGGAGGGGGSGKSNNQARRIVTYTPSTGAFTVSPNFETAIDTTTDWEIRLPEGVTLGMLRALNPTTPGRTADVSAGGCVGIDWSNVEAPSSANDFSSTKVAWNASWDAEVESEATDALNALGFTSTVASRIDAAVSTRLPSASYAAPLDAAATRAAVGLSTNNLETLLADLPTVAEFEARTITAGNYATAAALAAVAGHVDTEIAAILEDTGTTIPAQISALNNISSAGAQSACAAALAAYDPPTRAEATADKDEIMSRLGAPAGASMAADIAAVLVAVGQRATPAQVATEILDALRTDAGAEVSAPPAKDAPLAAQIQWVFQALRNGGTASGTQRTYRNDAGTTTGTQSASDSAGTLTIGRVA